MPAGETHLISDNYTPVGDLTVVAVCLVMLALIAFSYVRKNATFRVFLIIIPSLIFTALVHVACNRLAVTLGSVPVAYVLRCLYHASLFSLYFLYILYTVEVSRLDRRKTFITLCGCFGLLIAIIAADIVSSVRACAGGEPPLAPSAGGNTVFLIGYLLFSAVQVILLAAIRDQLYKRVMWGFYSSVIIAFGILVLQRIFGGGTSFTVASFLFPVLAMMYIIHSDPYDAETGTIDGGGLPDIIRYNYEKKKEFLYMSVFLPTLAGEGLRMPDAVRAVVRRIAMDYFRGALLFQLENGHMLLLFPKRRNPDYELRIEKMLRMFKEYHRVYQYDYKIVIGESSDPISRKNEYASFIRNIHRTMAINTVHRVSPEDIAAFDRSEHILAQLADIHRQHDLNDRRVLVYCQPVYNVKTDRYDTAEALMRLQLDELGLVFPDQFIFLAEENGYIHTLTEIILHKTCEEIRKLRNAGYQIGRISINVSMLELKGDTFCEDISNIISLSGISGEQVAIELTESQNESEFDLMKSKIAELKEKGITFYLDDFGTGYSNMERIIELPFDIIKFDRSLVIASGNSLRSAQIVRNMADLFRALNYSVLYEGVENVSDETLCRDMSASYLQGYKFSRPVPIAELRKFLKQKERVS